MVSPQTPIEETSDLPNITELSSLKLKSSGKRSRFVRFFSEDDVSSKTKPVHSAEPYSVNYAMRTLHTTTTAIAFRGAHQTRRPETEVQENHLEDSIDLCSFVRKGKYKVKSGCLGLISNSDSQKYPKFGVYSQSEHEDRTSMISLRTVLEGSERDFDTMLYADRLKLAVDISSGVLQVINTAWLQERITSQDIMFATKNGCPIYNQPFVVTGFSDPEQEIPVTDQALHLKTLKNAMFSLGILLSEILLFETLDHLWDAKTEEPTSRVLDQIADKAIGNLRMRIHTSSPKFYSAVHRLLFFQFRLDVSLGDEDFCKEIYGTTIALMEEDLKFSTSPW